MSSIESRGGELPEQSKPIIRLPNGQVITDEKRIDEFFDARRNKPKRDIKKSLQDIIVNPETLLAYEPQLEATVEINLGHGKVYDRPLYEEPDITLAMDEENKEGLRSRYRPFYFAVSTQDADHILIEARVIENFDDMENNLALIDGALKGNHTWSHPERREQLAQRREVLYDQLKQQVAARLQNYGSSPDSS